MKNNFFYKIKKSICNVEKYPEMATEGVPKALKYLLQMTIIISIVFSVIMVINIVEFANKSAEYLENKCPDFSYNDGALKIDDETKSPVITEENIGKVTIDTNAKDEQVNQYTADLSQQENGIVILSDKVIIKNENLLGTSTYEYKELLEPLGLKEFTKQDIIDYIKTGKINVKYLMVLMAAFCYYLAVYFINTISYVFVISILGYIVCGIIKMMIKYKAVFNMSVYSMTLPNILLILYAIINATTGFEIKYFSVMYVAIASIYIISAIFILKSEFIKKQAELIKIVEVQKEVKEEIKNKKEEKKKEEEKEDNKETGKENKEKDRERGIEREKEKGKRKEKDKNTEEEPTEKNKEEPKPEGSNA